MSNQHCPRCGGEDFSFSSFDLEGNSVIQEAVCIDCDAEWHDIYTLADRVVTTPVRMLAVIRGGILQDVYSDKLPEGVAVEFTVLDYDAPETVTEEAEALKSALSSSIY